MLNFEEELEKFQPRMLKKLKMLYTIIILPM